MINNKNNVLTNKEALPVSIFLFFIYFLLLGIITSIGNEVYAGNVSPVDSLGLNKASAMQQYMSLKKLNANRWVKSANGIKAKKPKLIRGDNNQLVKLVRSIHILNQSLNKGGKILRQVFIIQNSLHQPDADYPEHDSNKCEIFVLGMNNNKWQVESLDVFYVGEYGGGTRWARDCNGFEISWENELPVLVRTEIYGPYIGGMYVKNVEKVHRKAGKYKLEVVENKEGDFESIYGK